MVNCINSVHLLRKTLVHSVAVVALILAAGNSPALANEETLHTFGEIKDPYLGEALFQYYQQDSFMALSQSMVAQDADRLRYNKVQGKQLLAELYLSYGLHRDAEGVLTSLGRDSSTANIQDHAWLDLAEANYSRGLYKDAERALKQVGNRLDGDGPERMLAVQGALAMSNREYEKAATVFEKLRGSSIWGAYGGYNYGIALLNLGRFEKGVDELNKVGRLNVRENELKELKDHANLALGFLMLRAKDSRKAIDYLQRIRLAGAHSSRALLGISWAHMMNRDYETALAPLLELYKRSTGDGAVLESYLAVPYSYAQLKSDAQAVDYYEKAVGSFEGQLKEIETGKKKYGDKRFLFTVLERSDNNWTNKVPGWPHSASSRIFVRLMADPWFNATYNNYNDLITLRAKVKGWSAVVDVYDSMLQTRQKDGSSKSPSTTNTESESVTRRQLLKSRQMVDVNSGKMSDLKTRTLALKPSVDQAIKDHEVYLQKLTLSEFDREQARVNDFLTQARLGLAQLYDQLLKEGNR